MLRQLSGVILALGVVAAAATIGTSSSAVAQEAPKNISHSPREKIYELKDGTRIHIWIRNDGFYGMAIRDKNGHTQHFVINPRTGVVLPGTYPTGKVPVFSSRIPAVKDPNVLAVVKPAVEAMKPPVAVKPTSAAPPLHPAVTAVRPSAPAVSTTVNTTVGTPSVASRPATDAPSRPATTAVRPATSTVSTSISTTVGPVSITNGRTMASVPALRVSTVPTPAIRVPTVMPAIRR